MCAPWSIRAKVDKWFSRLVRFVISREFHPKLYRNDGNQHVNGVAICASQGIWHDPPRFTARNYIICAFSGEIYRRERPKFFTMIITSSICSAFLIACDIRAFYFHRERDAHIYVADGVPILQHFVYHLVDVDDPLQGVNRRGSHGKCSRCLSPWCLAAPAIRARLGQAATHC